MVGLADRIRSKAAELKTKARRDLQAADRKASTADPKAAVRRAARKAKRDARRVDRTVSDPERNLGRSAANRLQRLSNDDDPLDDVGVRGQEDVAARAEAAGMARAPIDATLDPMGNPRAFEAFATAGGRRPVPDEGEQPEQTSFFGGGRGGGGGGELAGGIGFRMGVGVGMGGVRVAPDTTGNMDGGSGDTGWFDFSGGEVADDQQDDADPLLSMGDDEDVGGWL